MSYNEGMLNTLSCPAGADLSAKQFYAVSQVNDTSNPPGVHLALTTAAAACTGILQDNPVSGQAGCVQTNGITKAAISASSSVTAGTTFLEVDSGGTLKPYNAGVKVAQALEPVTSQATIAIISVRLLPTSPAIS